MSKNILVTGATGFIGSNLCEKLFKENYNVFAVGVKGENKPICHKFLPINLDGFNFKELPNIDICFHQGANNDTIDKDEENMMESNVYSSLRLFERLHEEKRCNQFVYASSCSVYGNQSVPFFEDSKIDPLNPYAKSKRKLEELACDFSKEKKVNMIGLRYTNVYGLGESHKGRRSSMISQLLHTMIKKERPYLFKFGEQKRDWVYIKDIVDLNILAGEYQGSGIFNAGSGESTSFNDVVMYINKFLETKLEINYMECSFEKSYQSHTLVDLSKSKEHLKYCPKYSIKDGLFDFANQIKKDTI